MSGKRSNTLSEPESEQAGIKGTSESDNRPFYSVAEFSHLLLSLCMARRYISQGQRLYYGDDG